MVNWPVGQALTADSFESIVRAGRILDAERRTVVPYERSFVDVALQVLLADSVMLAVNLATVVGEEVPWLPSSQRQKLPRLLN